MGSSASKRATSSAEEEEEAAPIVGTKQGQIRGRLLKFGDAKAAQFLGVPFAQPPLGELRFKRPLPPLPWSGIRDAQKFAPQCTQAAFKIPGMLPNSEDCLYLNVFAPAPIAPTASPRPVMVFIHGGAFLIGSAKMTDPNGVCTNLVVPHQIVMVVIQYRLGMFGFYSTGDDACDDNVGLWDQTMALQWVQENIGAFGGDRHNVTLFGQSAGGMSVDFLALSPHSRDLFHKLIPMGGNGCTQKALKDNCVERCTEIAHKLGVHTTDSKKRIELLRGLAASKLAIGFNEFGNRSLGGMELPLGPRIDGQFFPKSLGQLRAEAPLKPCIVGLCQMEGAMFMALTPDKKYSLSLLEKFIAQEFPESEFPHNFVQLRAEALKMFTGDKDAEAFAADRGAVTRSIAEIFSDLFVGVASQQLANEQIARGNRHFYLYSFDHCNAKVLAMIGLFIRSKIPVKEATHGTELAYFFNTNPKFLLKDEDRKLTEIACKMWANFARFGDPNGPNGGNSDCSFRWEPVSAERPSQYLSIKPEPEMRAGGFQNGRPMHWLKLKNKL